MDLQKNIRERCHVNKNDEGDSFVGVKADTDIWDCTNEVCDVFWIVD